MTRGPKTADRLVFRGFHFISNDEGKNVEVRLSVRGSDNVLYSTAPVKSIWIQQGIFHATISDHYYWLELSKYESVRTMHEKAINKVMSFLEGAISAEKIWKMKVNVKGSNENERFYYAGDVE